jgi:adenosylcobyric acid synthase
MDGAHSADGRVWGCYLHGLFHNDQFRVAWLQSLGVSTVPELARTAHAVVNDSLNRLADVLETHLGLDRLLQQVGFTDRKAQHVIAR